MSDLRLAFRQLWKNPSFSIIGLVTLTLGIGATTAIFSVLNTVMLRPAPYPEPKQLVLFFRTTAHSQNWPHSVADYLDHREQDTAFEELAGFAWVRFSLAGEKSTGDRQFAESLRGIAATPEFFRVLKVQPMIGRLFTAEESVPGRNQVVLLSHGFWTRRFGGDTNIVGRALRMDGELVTVIGVMPAAFDYPQLWSPIDAWRPLAFSPEQRADRTDHRLHIIGRIKPGISPAQAQANAQLTAKRLAETYPAANANTSVRLGPLSESIGDLASRKFAWLLFGLTGFVLLIACVNLANLQLARAAGRSREMAVRLALGVGRWRLMRQLLVESVLLALLGGVLGIWLAIWLSDFIGNHINHPYFPHGLVVAVDARVLMFALLCTLVTGSLFGAAPAWLAARTDMNQMLKSSGRAATDGSSAHRLRNLLIVGEFAVALVLLTGAGLFVHGLQRFVEQDPGWRIDGLLTASAYQTGSQYSSPEKLGDFLDRLEQRLAALPGVQHAALCSSLPLWGFGQNHGFRIEGQPPPRPGEELLMQVAAVSPAHFAALEIRLREGRLFTSRDDASQPDVVVINEAMARRFWPGQSPLGKRIGTPDADHPRWLQIVGVVQDIRFPGNLSRPETQWQAYRPLSQDPHARVDLELRSGSPVEILVPALRQAIAELDSDLPLTEVTTARQRVSRLLSHFTIAGVLLRWFGALGLLLAALGIYGVISYFVVQRTNEIGIRMALGAQKSDVLGMVLRRGIILCSLGICLGLGGALSIAALLAAAMPELPGFEILSLAGVCVALFLAALFACWLPACRASRISPMEALRCD